jgi:Adenosine specific kinase
MAVNVDVTIVPLEKPEAVNLILGQSHFIKTVEDLHEALVGAMPGISFGLAFCESSGPRLVRITGTDPGLTELAARNAQAVGAGHAFIILGQRVSSECAQRDQERTRGLPSVLRHGQPRTGSGCRNRPGSGNSRLDRRADAASGGGRCGQSAAEGILADDWLQALSARVARSQCPIRSAQSARGMAPGTSARIRIRNQCHAG